MAFAGLGMGIAGTTMAGVSLTRLNNMQEQTQTNKLILNEIAISETPGANIAWVYADTSDNLHFVTLHGGDVVLGGSGSFLPLVGGTMQGSIDMNHFALEHVVELQLGENPFPTTPINGLQLYTQDELLYSLDSSAIIRQYVTANDLGPIGQALQVQSEILAPPGQRNNWSYGGMASGPSMFYDEFLDIVVSFDRTNETASSNDQGALWGYSADVAPTGPQIAGYNSTVIVSLGQTTNETYTSVDGVNFTKGPNHPATEAESYNVNWFSKMSLFVTGALNGGQRIMTSPDGLTWTLQVASLEALTIKSNNDICVAVGSTFPYAMWSENGTDWTLTLTPISSSRSLEWSDDRKEFVSIGISDNIVYRSGDGKTWEMTGNIVPMPMNDTLIWIRELGRYYYAAVDDDGNYSLYSSLSPYEEFLGTHLDGAANNVPVYGLVYLPPYETFLIGVNSSPYVAIGAPSTKIKALSDNIRVRGAPVQVCKFSAYSSVIVTGTTTETTISNPNDFLGSYVFQASQPLGMKWFSNLIMLVSVADGGGDTLTIRYKINNVTQHFLSIPFATTPPTSVNVDCTGTIQSGSAIYLASIVQFSGLPPILTNGFSGSYDPSIENTLSITAEWGISTSTLSVMDQSLSVLFLNG